MRTIKFRGKDILTDKWVYGDLLHLGNAYAIVTSYEEEELKVNPISDRLEIRVEDIVGVYPETVGQFTGLLDKIGKEIFEGDVIEWHQELTGIDKDGELVSYSVDWRGEVEYFHAAYFVEGIILNADLEGCRCNAEVVGNIHDNPELLKTEAL